MPAAPPLPPVSAPGEGVPRDPLSAVESASSEAILRVLRVALHTGFATLLVVGVVLSLIHI